MREAIICCFLELPFPWGEFAPRLMRAAGVVATDETGGVGRDLFLSTFARVIITVFFALVFFSPSNFLWGEEREPNCCNTELEEGELASFWRKGREEALLPLFPSTASNKPNKQIPPQRWSFLPL